jgi:hypothetical protein
LDVPVEPAQRIDDRLMVAQQLIYYEADATVTSRDDDHHLDWGRQLVQRVL